MKFGKAAVLAAATGSASAATSICDKYTTALLKQNTAANQYTLLSLLVNTAVIGNYTGPGTSNSMLPGSMVNVPGILAPAGGLLPYFNGDFISTNRMGVAKSVSFLDGGGATYIMANPTKGGMPGSNQMDLLTSLYSYFGNLLGCTGYGTADFPAYSGDPSQYSVHKFMDLNNTQVTYFIDQVGAAALSFGASQSDATTVGDALNKAFNYKCSPPETIVKAQGAQLQAICIDPTCPEAPMATCAAYAPVVMPSMIASSMMMESSMMGTATVGALTDNQPTATGIGALTDHQPTATGIGALTDHQPTATALATYTGAAPVHAAPTAVAALAALAYLAL